MSVLIIPGVDQPETQHWQSFWEDQIPDARRIRRDDGTPPDRDRWLQRLVAEVEQSPGAILVGHSLGATLIAHLARSRPDLPVGGALLVAPADPDLDLNRSRLPGLATFAPLPLDRFLFPAIVVASRADRYMALERARVLAKMWEAEFVDDGGAGPVDVGSRLGAWPEGRTLLERLRAPRGYLRPALKFAAVKPPQSFAEAPAEGRVAPPAEPEIAPPDFSTSSRRTHSATNGE
jgi:predicted alpha/beta hydrolase family esterase